MPVTGYSVILRNTLDRNLGDDRVAPGPRRNNITVKLRNNSNNLELDNKAATLQIKLNLDGIL